MNTNNDHNNSKKTSYYEVKPKKERNTHNSHIDNGDNTFNEVTKIFALGGLEEIGKNTYVLEQGDEIIIIDAGVKFPDASTPGIEAVIPDYSYLKENQHKIKGLVITHGHEDHIGGIPYLLKEIPSISKIYAPKFAKALINYRIKEKFRNNERPKTKIEEVDGHSIIKTNNFTVSFFAVNHSIPDAFGVYVKTSNGTIVSTGDYKFD